jgi:hypothetical protein
MQALWEGSASGELGLHWFTGATRLSENEKFFCKVKEGEDFDRRNTLGISRTKI